MRSKIKTCIPACIAADENIITFEDVQRDLSDLALGPPAKKSPQQTFLRFHYQN